MMYHGNSMDFLRFSPTKKNGLPHGLGILGDSQQLISLKKTMNTPTPSFDFPIPPVKHGSHLQGWSLQRPAIMFIHFPYGDPILGSILTPNILVWFKLLLFVWVWKRLLPKVFGDGNEETGVSEVNTIPCLYIYIYMCVAS